MYVARCHSNNSAASRTQIAIIGNPVQPHGSREQAPKIHRDSRDDVQEHTHCLFCLKFLNVVTLYEIIPHVYTLSLRAGKSVQY